MGRLTVLLGSGFSEGMGLPGTEELTGYVRSLERPVIHAADPRERSITVADAMWRMASSYYTHPNFETMLHLVETAMAYSGVKGWLAADDRAKAAFGAFMTIMPHWQDFVETAARSYFEEFYSAAIQEVAHNLIDRIDSMAHETRATCAQFFGALRQEFELAIATLNYDDLIERSLEDWQDGFQHVGDRWLFSPKAMTEETVAPLILHLHGSIRFYIRSDARPHVEIYRAESPQLTAPETRSVQWRELAQSGDTLIVGPMISGLRKTDKITVPPFGYYQYKLHDCLLRSSRLLVIGYGGGDNYINSLLLQMRRIHGNDFRAAFVTKPKELTFADYGFLVPWVIIGDRTDDFRERCEAAKGSGNFVQGQNGILSVDGFPLGKAANEQLITFLK